MVIARAALLSCLTKYGQAVFAEQRQQLAPMGWIGIGTVGLNDGTIIKGDIEDPVSAIARSRADIAAISIENATAQKALTKLCQTIQLKETLSLLIVASGPAPGAKDVLEEGTIALRIHIDFMVRAGIAPDLEVHLLYTDKVC